MKRASYREAVRWISENDSAADGDVEVIRDYVTTCLVADIFGKSTDEVADAVARIRMKRD